MQWQYRPHVSCTPCNAGWSSCTFSYLHFHLPHIHPWLFHISITQRVGLRQAPRLRAVPKGLRLPAPWIRIDLGTSFVLIATVLPPVDSWIFWDHVLKQNHRFPVFFKCCFQTSQKVSDCLALPSYSALLASFSFPEHTDFHLSSSQL